MIRDPFDVDAAVEAHREEELRRIREDQLVEIEIEEQARRARERFARERFARETGGHPDDAPIVESDLSDLR